MEDKKVFGKEELATLKFSAGALVLAVLFFFMDFLGFAGICAIAAVLGILRILVRVFSKASVGAKQAVKTAKEVATPVVVDDSYVCSGCGATFQLKTEVCPNCGGKVVRDE